MFKEIIGTLEAVEEAIIAKDRENAEAGLTIALVQIVDLLGDNKNNMQKLYPMMEALRGEIQTEQFQYASETAAIILEFFQGVQQETVPAEPHEAAWAKETEALHARLRASGHKVTVKDPPTGEQPLVATFHNPSAKKQKPSEPSPPRRTTETGEKE